MGSSKVNRLLSSSKNDLLSWDYRTFPSAGVGNPHLEGTPLGPGTLQRERTSGDEWVSCK